MRNFKAFENELLFNSNLTFGMNTNRVKKMQQWLVIDNYSVDKTRNILSEIDGKFGNRTLEAVKKFQKKYNLPETGIIDRSTFNQLTLPLKSAFSIAQLTSINTRNLILEIATIHLKNNATEILNPSSNRGPWVRSYCNGDDDEAATNGPKWCAGFVKTIIDIACDKMKIDFNIVFKNSLDCDEIANWAKRKNSLIKNENLATSIERIQKGDLFLTYSTTAGSEWVHIGFIIDIKPNGDITTIEGNASEDSELNGSGERVIKKKRNLFNVFYFNNNVNVPVNDPRGHKNYYEVITLNV